MATNIPLLPGHTYHVYNRGNNRDPIFFEPRNYRYFLDLYTKYIHPIADTYAYCLLRNHFHFLIRIKTGNEDVNQPTTHGKDLARTSKPTSRHFNNMFIAYAKAINSTYNHTGSVFEKPFRRKMVKNESYFVNLLIYIHHNPQHHRVVSNFREWHWSSYHTILRKDPTRVQRADVLATFGSREEFIEAHKQDVSKKVTIDWS